MEYLGASPLLQVFDMRLAVHFYRDVLGFTLVNLSSEGDESDWCLLDRGGAELMLNTMYESDQRPLQPDGQRAAAHGDTVLYFACRDLDSAYDHLQAKEVKVQQPRVAPYGLRQLSFQDPDGYGICSQWPATEESAEQWRSRYSFEV